MKYPTYSYCAILVLCGSILGCASLEERQRRFVEIYNRDMLALAKANNIPVVTPKSKARIEAEIEAEARKAEVERAARLAVPQASDTSVSAERARSLLIGRFSGIACGGQGRLNLSIDRLSDKNSRVVGFVTIASTTNLTGRRVALSGRFYNAYGFLVMESQPAQPRFRLDVARDSSGEGWIGVVEGDGLDNCGELRLTSDSGAKTNGLLPQNYHSIMRREVNGEETGFKSTERSWTFWLARSKEMLDDSATGKILMARYLESGGRFSPSNYAQALIYYLEAAKTYRGAFIQTRIAHIYREGLGVAKNQREADRWQSMADATVTLANEFCQSSDTLKMIRAVVEEYPYRATLIGVKAANIYSMIEPFDCKAVAARNVSIRTSPTKVDAASGDNVEKDVVDYTGEVIGNMVLEGFMNTEFYVWFKIGKPDGNGNRKVVHGNVSW